MTPFQDPKVELVFADIPTESRRKLMQIREMIFEVASSDERIGTIEETLKWRQPSYLTSETKSGTTIRLGATKTGGFGIYTHCQTSVMSDFKSIFSDLNFDGNRGLLFDKTQIPPETALEQLIKSALTYHLKA